MKTRKRKARKNRATNKQQPMAGGNSLASAIARSLRLPLLPIAAGSAMTANLLVSGGEITSNLAAAAAAAIAVYIFIMALNDLLDRKADAEGSGSPGRINPIAQGHLSVAVASGITIAALVAAMALTAHPAVSPLATLAAVMFGAAYSLGLKKFPPLAMISLGLCAAALSAIGLTGPAAGQWVVLPMVSGYIVTMVMAFAWAWERRRPVLWGNNWLILLLLCSAMLPGIDKLVTHFSLQYSPEAVNPRNTVITALMILPVALAVFFRSSKIRRGTMLRFIGLLWLAPVWMSLLNSSIDGNAIFVPVMCLVASAVFVQLSLFLGSTKRK